MQIDKSLSFGPAPSVDELERLSREYSHVVVLAHPHELRYDVRMWNVLGVEALHVAVPDFRSPPLLDLVDIVEWIVRRVDGGGRVYVHCVGGLGRSATVAAAYLIRRYGKSWFDATTQVRRLKKGSLESVEQVSVLKAYESLLKYLNPTVLVENLECPDRRSRNHLSKILQIGMNVSESFSSLTRTSRHALLAGLIHNIIEYLERVPAKCTLRGLPILREANSVSVDDNVSELIKYVSDLATASDKLMDQCVEDLEVKVVGGVSKAFLYCSGGCWSSCVIVSEEVKEALSGACSLLKCVPEVEVMNSLNVDVEFLNPPLEGS